MIRPPIAAVMIHVGDVEKAFIWYQAAFPNAVRARVDDPEFEFLVLDGVRLELVPADEKLASGAAGTVVYWRAEDFDGHLSRLQALGAALYRGPMDIENRERMCQLLDPWGNCIGLRGRSALSESSGSGRSS